MKNRKKSLCTRLQSKRHCIKEKNGWGEKKNDEQINCIIIKPTDGIDRVMEEGEEIWSVSKIEEMVFFSLSSVLVSWDCVCPERTSYSEPLHGF